MARKEYPEPIIAQAIAVGNPFKREIGNVDVRGTTKPIYGSNRVFIIIGIEGGTIFYSDTRSAPIDPSILPHISLEDIPRQYGEEASSPRSWITVYKRGASRKVYPLEERGNPSHKIPKPASSFRSSVIGKQIEAATSNQPNTEPEAEPPSSLDEIPF